MTHLTLARTVSFYHRYDFSFGQLVLLLALCLSPRASAEKHRKTVPLPVPEKASSTKPAGNKPKAQEFRPMAGSKTAPAVEYVPKSKSVPELPGAPVCSQKLSLETFIQIASHYKPQASKDGVVYFVSDMRETPQLYRTNGPGLWPTQLSFFPDGIKFFALSPDGQKILLTSDIGGNEQYNVFLLEVSSKKLTPLLNEPDVRVESFAWSADSTWFAYTANKAPSTDFPLYRFSLKTMKAEQLADLKGTNYVSDISNDGTLIALTNYRSVTDSDILIWSAGKPIQNFSQHEGEQAYSAGRFTADSAHLLYLSDRERGFSQLYLGDLKNPKTVKPVSSENWDVSDLEVDASRKFLVYLTNQDGYDRWSGFEMDAAGGKKKMLVLPKDTQNLFSSPSLVGSSGGPVLYYTKSSTTEPADIYSWRQQKETRWTRPSGDAVDPRCLIKEKLVRYPSFDRREIPGFLYLPPDANGPIPFLVHVHGGPEAQFRPGFSKMIQYVLQRGFGVFAPNVRGSTGYGKDFTLLDNYKKRMDSVQDVIEGTKWLLGQRYTEKGRVGIFGGSYGGFLVLRSIEVEPELFSAASSSVGIANFVTFLKNTKPYRRPLREVEYGPLSDETFLASVSPITYIDKIQTPLYLFHGANDPRVPANETEQVVEELKKRNVPVESRVFSDEGHGNTKLRNILEQARLMAYFFEKHLARPADVATKPN